MAQKVSMYTCIHIWRRVGKKSYCLTSEAMQNESLVFLMIFLTLRKKLCWHAEFGLKQLAYFQYNIY